MVPKREARFLTVCCCACYLGLIFLYCYGFLSSVLTQPPGPSLARLLTTYLIIVIGMNSARIWWNNMSYLELATSHNIPHLIFLFYSFLYCRAMMLFLFLDRNRMLQSFEILYLFLINVTVVLDGNLAHGVWSWKTRGHRSYTQHS